MNVLLDEEVAKRIGIAKATLATRKSRTPWRLPPQRKLPGGELVFFDVDVEDWLANAPLVVASQPSKPQRRGRGRPSKREQLAYRAAAV